MTREEIETRREQAALALFSRSGVGYSYALDQFSLEEEEAIRNLELASSGAEALVKMALQFAFCNVGKLREFMAQETGMKAQDRFFYVVR